MISRKAMFRTPYPALLIAVSFLINPLVSADEILVEGDESRISVGDFDCGGCNCEATNALNLLMDQSSGQVRAGELWKFFNEQGLTSVEQLTLSVDILPENEVHGDIGISGLRLMIEDPNSVGFLTDASLGEHSLIVPEYEISSFKPEARLQVALGYDFMERFSADSQEMVQFGFSQGAASAITPRFAVEGNEASLVPSGIHWSALVGFIAFWGVVFLLLSRVTRPKLEVESAAALSQPANASGRQLAT